MVCKPVHEHMCAAAGDIAIFAILHVQISRCQPSGSSQVLRAQKMTSYHFDGMLGLGNSLCIIAGLHGHLMKCFPFLSIGSTLQWASLLRLQTSLFML